MLEHAHVSEISLEWGWSLLTQAVAPTRQLTVTMTKGEQNAHKIPPTKNLMHCKIAFSDRLTAEARPNGNCKEHQAKIEIEDPKL